MMTFFFLCPSRFFFFIHLFCLSFEFRYVHTNVDGVVFMCCGVQKDLLLIIRSTLGFSVWVFFVILFVSICLLPLLPELNLSLIRCNSTPPSTASSVNHSFHPWEKAPPLFPLLSPPAPPLTAPLVLLLDLNPVF